MRDDDTPLTDAARHGRRAEVMRLLAAGTSVDDSKRDGSGTTALFIASQEGHLSIVTALIEAGAAVNQATDRGNTPLYIAAAEATHQSSQS